ncbi:hypothetical protein [Spirosoma utsteinense]|uniref:Uncharacterized protein n=1 Tax=Spirosoma utsteinense TaxID=2585773 RepID=A0ABR6W5H4_9BACT|nr:hypothetical protein [Spirosoma utsteinense]MBC3786215.1 hypothetical protein [Spirosoma utsteinense]MBC3791841.1 hypothetical protein [Spirosoma utsteinense]
MSDTPNHVRRIYADFIMQKSDIDRFNMGFEMADTGQKMVEMNLIRQHPNWSVGQLKAAVFERIYRTDFSADEMNRIMEAMVMFHDQKKD